MTPPQALFVALSLALGCAPEVTFVGSPATAGEEENERPTVPRPEEEEDDVDPGFCDESCSARGPDGCLSLERCVSHCTTHVGGWAAPVRDAFAACVADDPLCFITVEGCMLGQLGPEGRSVRVQGYEFHAHEGRAVSVRSASGDLEGTSTIVSGAFTFEWVRAVETFDQAGPLMLTYIDVDDDGACVAALDVTAAEEALWNGSFDFVEFALTLTPPLDDPDFVCDSF